MAIIRINGKNIGTINNKKLRAAHYGPKTWYLGDTPFLYTINNNEVTITKYIGNEPVVEIPTTIENCPVVTIGEEAFKENKVITSVSIPDGITLESAVFMDCSKLKAVRLPSDLKCIPKWLFLRCYKLENLIIPNTVETIEKAAISDCESLTSITIPNSVTTLESNFDYCKALTNVTLSNNISRLECNFFLCENLTTLHIPAKVAWIINLFCMGCNSLTSITVDPANNYFTAIDGILFNKELTELWRYPSSKTGSSYTIPSTVLTIKQNAFEGSKFLKTIPIPTSVTTLESMIFENSLLLESCSLPATITSVEGYLFENCPNLTSVEFLGDNLALDVYTFKDCSKLKDVKLPAKITAIPRGSFMDCTSLTSINLPSTVTTLQDMAFNGSGLISIELPYNLTSIVNGAFASSKNLANVNFSKKCSGLQGATFINCKSMRRVTCPTNFTTLTNCLSQSTTTLIWQRLTPPGRYSTELVYNFEGVNTTINLTIYASEESLTTYATEWQAWCNYIKDAVITLKPALLSSDDNFTYDNTTVLSYNRNNPVVIVPTGITAIDTDVFANRIDLESVEFPETLTSIGGYNLGSIPEITLRSVTPPALAADSFNCYDTGTGDKFRLQKIYVPKAAVEAYKSAPIWSDYKDYIYKMPLENDDIFTYDGTTLISYNGNYSEVTVVEGVTAIADSVFADKTEITKINLPTTLTTIGNTTFKNCSGLSTINLPENLTAIGTDAFISCSSLTNVVLPSNLISLGEGAFDNCSSLTTISIPGSVSDLNRSIFYNCIGLQSVTIASGITKIPEYAFSGCTNLVSVNLPNTVISIEKAAFQNCEKLTTLNLPENLTSIGAYAFNGCKSLPSSAVNLSNSITSIGTAAFQDCDGLTYITLPNSLTTLSSNLFNSCDNLKVIEVPSSVTAITSSFAWCSSSTGAGVEAIYLPASITKITTSPMQGSQTASVLYCEPTSKPSGWTASIFNKSGIHWGAKKSDLPY